MHELFVFEHEPFGMRVLVDGVVVLRVYRDDDFVLELYSKEIETLDGHPRYKTIVETLDSIYSNLKSKFDIRNELNRVIRERSVEVTPDLLDASERVMELCNIMRDHSVALSLRRNSIFELNGWLHQLLTYPDAGAFTGLYRDSKPNVWLLDYNLYDVIYFANVLFDYCHYSDDYGRD